jgi:exoribonuclease II
VNLQSEITFFSEMATTDKARLMASFLSELTAEARSTYGSSADVVHDAAHLRFSNEICHRITKLIEQYLGDDKTRPADDVVLRMLLSPRADKVAERMAHNAYRRALQNFERYDTTVFMNS